MDVQKLLKDCVNDQSLLTFEVHQTIIKALTAAFNQALKLSDENLMFTYKDQYTFFTKEARINYRFKYGSMTVETMADRLFVSCDLDVVALDVLNVPFNVVQFSLNFDNYLNYKYAYFTNHFYIMSEKKASAILHLEQRHYTDRILVMAGGQILNLNNTFFDLKGEPYYLSESYFNDNIKLTRYLKDFLDLLEVRPLVFKDIFEEYMPYLNQINSLLCLVKFLNFFSEQYSNNWEALEQKFMLCEMHMI